MKRLTITYDGRVWFDGDVSEVALTDSDSKVSVVAAIKRANTSASVSGLGDLIARASKAKTAAVAQEKREAAANE